MIQLTYQLLSNSSFFGLMRGYSSILSITPLHGVGIYPHIQASSFSWAWDQLGTNK